MKKTRLFLLVLFLLVTALTFSGCSDPADYKLTEEVVLKFMEANIKGDVNTALEYVSQEAVLVTDGGRLKGKDKFGEMIKLNVEKHNSMEILEKQKIDNSKIMLIIANRIPLFQIAGVDLIKTKEIFHVKDGKIVKWDIKYDKDSMDLIESVASGTVGIETEEKNGKIVVKNCAENSPAARENIQKGDIILAIDGVELKDMKYGYEEVPYRLVGRVGSRVDLKMQRGTEVFVVTLTRVNIEDLK